MSVVPGDGRDEMPPLEERLRNILGGRVSVPEIEATDTFPRGTSGYDGRDEIETNAVVAGKAG